jgi:hypothetical protein
MVRGHHWAWILLTSGVGLLISLTGCRSLEPKNILKPSEIFRPEQEFGLIAERSYTVPATTDIFLARSTPDASLEYAPENSTDVVPDHSPVKALEGDIRGGDTLDIYATGQARHQPRPQIEFGPKGWIYSMSAGPANGIYAIKGNIGALVGLFDNQRQPFIIGQRKQIDVPSGARSLYLAVLDYPGASSNNQGEYLVTINVIRR